MDTAVITALITAAASVVCQLIVRYTAERQERLDREKHNSLVLYRLDRLEHAVEKQSSMLERLSAAEQRIASIEHTRNIRS